jgi:hypothetical protein
MNTILPHGPLEQLGPNLWRVWGEVPRFPLRRVMVVARYETGDLLIHNAIQLNEESKAQLESLGKPRVMVVPNGFHRLDAPTYKALYPEIKVFCPRGSRKKVEGRVPVDGTLDEMPSDNRISMRHLDGVREFEGALTVQDEDGATLVCNDLIFNQPHFSGFLGFAFRYLGDVTGGPKISRVEKLLFIKNKAAFRDELLRLAETPRLHRVIVAHGDLIEENPAEVLRGLAASL